MQHSRDGLHDTGMSIRRQVLGDEYVDRSIRHRTPFNESLQDLIAEYCWGTVWSRDGLDLRTRSLLNVGVLIALNRNEELKLHLIGALNNGCTEEEISEAILQCAIYCGVPAALEASRTATEVIQERSSS